MKSQDELKQLRAAHPEKWQRLADAGLKPQRIAAIISAHNAEEAEQLALNPPLKQAQAKAAAAAAVVRTHLERAELAKGEFNKLVTELRAEFPDLEIEVLEVDTGSAANDDERKRIIADFKAAAAEIEQLRKDKAVQDERIQQLEDAAAEQAKALAAEVEAHNVSKSDAANQAAALRAAGEKITAALAAKSLKAAHEALS